MTLTRTCAQVELGDGTGLPYRYRIVGLELASCFPIASAIAPSDSGRGMDVSIEEGFVPEIPEGDAVHATHWSIGPDAFVFRPPGIGRILALQGRTMRVMPAPGATLSWVEPYLLGTAFGALLYQRGGLALHASAVAFDGKAFLVTGPSGRGKSTLSAALCALGCAILCDDFSRLEQTEQGFLVRADRRRSKLAPSTCSLLGIEHLAGEVASESTGKIYVDLPRSPDDALVLAGILTVDVDPEARVATTRRLPYIDAVNEVVLRTYRRRLQLAYVDGQTVAARAAAIAAQCDIWQVLRPNDPERALATAALILDAMRRARR